MPKPTTPQNAKKSPPPSSLFGDVGTDLSVDEPLDQGIHDNPFRPPPPPAHPVDLLADIPTPPSIPPVGAPRESAELELVDVGVWTRLKWKLEPLQRRIRLKLMLVRIKFPRAAAWVHGHRRALKWASAAAIAAGTGALVFVLSGPSASELQARTITIKPAIAGTVAKVAVTEDAAVSKDAVVLVIAPDDRKIDPAQLQPFQKKLQAAQAELARAKSPVELKKATAEVAKRKAELVALEKAEKKLKAKRAPAKKIAAAHAKVVAAQETLARASEKQATLADSGKAIAAAEEAVKTAETELYQAKANAGLVEVRSPVAGKVLTANPETLVGTKIQSGDAVLAVLTD